MAEVAICSCRIWLSIPVILPLRNPTSIDGNDSAQRAEITNTAERYIKKFPNVNAFMMEQLYAISICRGSSKTAHKSISPVNANLGLSDG
jgi:hypothetical protein